MIGGRYAMKIHFQKKFSKRPPPAVIVAIVKNENFYQKLETYGTALSNKTTSFRIKKTELLESINFDQKVKKGDLIAKLKTGNITAPFSGILGKRGISESTLGSGNSIILTLDDTSIIFSDLKIPEIYAGIIKKGLSIEAKFAAYKNKIYRGNIESVASRIDAQTRSILTRVKIKNENSELIPGSLLEIQIKYNERYSLSIPDTSVIHEGNKKFVYKVLENNTVQKIELLESINFDQRVKKGDLIAKLKTRNIVAPFSGILGKRGISESTLGSGNSIILTLDDTSIIFSDLKIPEIYAGIIKKGLPIEAKFAAYKNKIYRGNIESVASRIDAQTRSILTRVKIKNENSELIPGSLLEIQIKYNERDSLSIPDTGVIYEGDKKFAYKVLENNTVQKIEITTGTRNKGKIELLSGLVNGNKIVAEGLTKVRPRIKIKPIIKPK